MLFNNGICIVSSACTLNFIKRYFCLCPIVIRYICMRCQGHPLSLGLCQNSRAKTTNYTYINYETKSIVYALIVV